MHNSSLLDKKRFVGCNCGHVKAADESQSVGFCFKYYGGWIKGPTISIANIPIINQIFWLELG